MAAAVTGGGGRAQYGLFAARLIIEAMHLCWLWRVDAPPATADMRTKAATNRHGTGAFVLSHSEKNLFSLRRKVAVSYFLTTFLSMSFLHSSVDRIYSMALALNLNKCNRHFR